MATTTIGRQAETAVADYLKRQGYKILAQNWKTPRCEIDIVAVNHKTAYLVEVKYRSADAQGSGFEYIGPQKLKQMRFAAKVWEQEFGWPGDIELLAAEVSGVDFENIELIEIS